LNGHGEKLSRKQEQAIAALLAEPTIAAAAGKVKVGERTLREWLKRHAFRAAYGRARSAVVEAALGRLRQVTGEAVDTLRRNLSCGRPGDEIRAAVAVLDHALRDFEPAGNAGDEQPRAITGTGDVVQLLAERLRQVDAAELPTAEKSRLTATLADALLRAIGVDVIDKRLEALQAVLIGRKGEEKR
jgi:hypothetical protein